MPCGALPLGAGHTAYGWVRSVPVRRARLPRGPGVARVAVGHLDVPETPLDLGQRVGAVVGTELRHLAGGQGLRDAVRARAGVLGEPAPVALAGPQVDEAVVLRVARPAVVGHEDAGGGLGVALGVVDDALTLLGERGAGGCLAGELGLLGGLLLL